MKSEFQLIENLRARYSLSKIGDDCAVLPKDSRTDTVITTDLLVEDVDFKLAWSKPEFIGHKALAVSLSDVAAMGAKPLWAMLSIGVPKAIWKTDFVERFYTGYMRLANRFGVDLIGGDISKTPAKIVIDSIAAGEVKKGKAVLRSGAKVGDLIFVSGNLGGAAAALELLQTGEKYDDSNRQKLLLRQLAPHPQVEIGRLLGAGQLAASMIDLSDGLSSDLTHLCRASKVGAKIFVERLPFDPNLAKLKNSFDENLSLVLNGGEDFELLFTISPKKYFRAANEFKKHGFSRIGEITSNVEIIELIHGAESSTLSPKGFRHF